MPKSPKPDSRPDNRGSVLLLTAVTAAAIGAGVALLLAPEEGVEARRRLKRRLRSLELREQARSLGARASRRMPNAELRRALGASKGESPSQGGSPLSATVGVLVGAGVALLLAPESGPRTRQRLSAKLQQFKGDASTRWRAHRTSHRSSGNGFGDPGNDPTGAPAGDPAGDPLVRTIQELGRDSNQVF